MPWWPWRGEPAAAAGKGPTADAVLRVELPAPRVGERADQLDPVRGPAAVSTVTMTRVAEILDRLEIRYLTDGDGSLLAMWERHAVLFALEGPEDEILVMRARAHSTVPPDWVDRAYRVVNEWNHTRRFCKAYVGDPTERGQLPIYAEMQVPLVSGVHDALLTEMVDCSAAVAVAFVDWLHEDGGLL
jgi:hypothetical protein